jgi:photosystem II stability/assembly factor-like uncharacterized protein
MMRKGTWVLLAMAVAWLVAALSPGLAEEAQIGLVGDRVQQRQSDQSQEQAFPTAPSVQALAVAKDHVLYAGSFGLGVFRSDDRGDSWSPVNHGLTDPFVYCLAAADDGTIFAGTVNGGVFQSRDKGRSWQKMNAGLNRLEVKVLLIANGVLYAGTGDGAYRHSPQDNRWIVVTKGLDETLVYALAMNADQILFAGTSGKGVFRDKGDGSGWKRLSHGLVDHEGLIENFIRVLAVDKQQALYAGTFDGGVFRSSDGGQSWKPISRALPNDSIRGIITGENGLFVATGRGIFKTVDHGRQWIPLNRGLTELSVQVLIASGEGGFYAGTSSGVFRSRDEGRSWINISEGLRPPGDAPGQ